MDNGIATRFNNHLSATFSFPALGIAFPFPASSHAFPAVPTVHLLGISGGGMPLHSPLRAHYYRHSSAFDVWAGSTLVKAQAAGRSGRSRRRDEFAGETCSASLKDIARGGVPDMPATLRRFVAVALASRQPLDSRLYPPPAAISVYTLAAACAAGSAFALAPVHFALLPGMRP